MKKISKYFILKNSGKKPEKSLRVTGKGVVGE
jgi:hypothetical protein